MSLPPDKPQLRKAGDADIHPSAPTADEARFGRLGSWTSDAVGAPDKDKLVNLDVQVPKSLRKAVRAEADRRGVPVDDVVCEALRERPIH